MPKFRVEVIATYYVEVKAKDEDEAADKAIDSFDEGKHELEGYEVGDVEEVE